MSDAKTPIERARAVLVGMGWRACNGAAIAAVELPDRARTLDFHVDTAWASIGIASPHYGGALLRRAYRPVFDADPEGVTRRLVAEATAALDPWPKQTEMAPGAWNANETAAEYEQAMARLTKATEGAAMRAAAKAVLAARAQSAYTARLCEIGGLPFVAKRDVEAGKLVTMGDVEAAVEAAASRSVTAYVVALTGRELCDRCSVDGVRVMRRERGEVRVHVWACGCVVAPTRISEPEPRPACACGAAASRMIPASGETKCGECARDDWRGSVPVYIGRAHEWFIGGHGAGEFGPTREVAEERWREALAEAQRKADES